GTALLTAPVGLQPKLTVNAPGDPYEQEANRVAAQVMRMPEPSVQRQCACGSKAGGECEECQKAGRGAVPKNVPRVAAGLGAVGEAPASVQDVLNTPGQPLDTTTRGFFEPRFGRDLSSVRVHTDPAAADSAAAVQARAYTVGPHITFADGQFAPVTGAGRALLAHELTHVIQQNSTRPPSLIQRQPAAATPQPFPTIFGAESPTQSASRDGSFTLDAFALDKSDLTAEHQRRILRQAQTMVGLLHSFPDSFVTVVGHTDATGSEAHNKALGQQRADSVLEALVAAGVPRDAARSGSLGEGVPLVDTQAQEPRNRRVEINFTARGRAVDLAPGLRAPGEDRGGLTPTPPPQVDPGLNRICVINPDLCKPDSKPDPFKKLPDSKPQQQNPLKDALERDPIIRALPKDIREKAVDALKDADEGLADTIIGALPLDGKLKAALKATIKGLLQSGKGKKFEVPNPSPYELPPSVAPQVPSAPTLDSPPIRF
ncbi:MAG TPA: DUF4157 domain-containing protein, partial [Urbifossiella sp.]|nr:DUF4157 domain-containing protein [Urbifossiella sp.]